MTPELKFLSVAMPFEGEYTQEQYTQQLIDEYKKAGVRLRAVYPSRLSWRIFFTESSMSRSLPNRHFLLDERHGEDPTLLMCWPSRLG